MTIARREKETFSRWDAADYLKSEADATGYLEACIAEAPGDPALIAAALDDIARAQRKRTSNADPSSNGDRDGLAQLSRAWNSKRMTLPAHL
jgi:hypothetical protein